MQKKRIPSLDFVRLMCTLGIIANHFAISSGNALMKKLLYTYPNGYGSVGYTFVTVFFLLSGGVLYYSNKRPVSVRKFLFKRWKAIFPSYYIAFALAMIVFLLFNKSFFTGKRLSSLVFTFFGMDGYLANVIPTWEVIGEWFIGALIICYLLYPLIAYMLEKEEILTFAVLLGLYALTLNWDMLNQNAFRNVFSCMVSFTAGIILMRHYNQLDFKKAGLISLLLLLLSVVLPVRLNNNVMAHMNGLWLFVFLNLAGRYVMKNHMLSAVVHYGAKLSFEVFLVHHVIVTTVLHFIHPDNTVLLIPLLLLVVLLSVVCGGIVYGIRTFVVNKICRQ